MKKSNLLLLMLICILFFCLSVGLLIYAFNLQARKDQQGKGTTQEDQMTLDDNNITGLPDITGEPTGSSIGEGTDQVGDTQSASGDTSSDTASDGSLSATDSGDTSSDSSSGDTSSNSSSGDTSDSDDDQAAASVTPVPDSNSSVKYSELPETATSNGASIILGFAGDVNLDESYYPVAKYDAEEKEITGCFSQDVLNEMQNADIMMVNNEFPYSTRGTKEEDKSFTFRADPSRVEILQKMGVDIVSLANNHALDYGPEALEDTFDTLDNAGIEYVGAGDNLDRAKSPIYYKVADKTIAYVAASRVVFAMDWYASEDKSGMVGTYDPTLILESIREAKANSDFVVIYVHWGVERDSYPEDYQRTMAKQYIDAGADAVIGCHPHVMQGMEFYNGKPIVYSLGNYWFNKSTKESGMIKLYLGEDDSMKVQLLPAMNKDTFTYLLTDTKEKKKYYDYIQGLSYHVNIDENGYLTATE